MKKLSKLSVVALLLTTSCVSDDTAPKTNAAVTVVQPVAEHVVRASRFVYDAKAERVVATRFVYDASAPALHGSAFAVMVSN
jgi:hypothetical protein